MRSVSIVGLLLLAGCPGSKTTTPPPDNGGGGGDGGPGFWHVLAVPGSTWVLHDSNAEYHSGSELTVSVAEVRQVAGADVVTLSYSVRYEADGDPENSGGSRWAVTPKGLWQLDDEADDAAIEAALQAPPTWPSPPVEHEAETGPYARIAED